LRTTTRTLSFHTASAGCGHPSNMHLMFASSSTLCSPSKVSSDRLPHETVSRQSWAEPGPSSDNLMREATARQAIWPARCAIAQRRLSRLSRECAQQSTLVAGDKKSPGNGGDQGGERAALLSSPIRLPSRLRKNATSAISSAGVSPSGAMSGLLPTTRPSPWL